MAVIRVNKTGDYTVMSNTHFKEKEMSLKAKGLLSLMLSLPENWDYSVAGLVALSKDGKDSVTASLCELEELGYLIRKRVTDEKGRFAGYEYNIFENPQTEKPLEEKPFMENPSTEKPTQLNTKILNTKILNTKKSNTNKINNKKKKSPFEHIILEYSKTVDISIRAEVTDLLFAWLDVRKAKRAAMTERAVEMNIKKLSGLAQQSNLSVVEYLKEIVCRGWAAFYPINNFERNSKRESQKPSYDIAEYERRTIDSWNSKPEPKTAADDESIKARAEALRKQFTS